MLDDDKETGKIYIVCDVPVGDDFCKERIDFDEVCDIRSSMSSGPAGDADFQKWLESRRAHIKAQIAIFNECHRKAFAAGWGEHIYPGEGSVLDDKRRTHGINDLCPKHVNWKP